ncbi:Dothistromin biosynthesis regulatory protein aflJ [Metarhizium anisopliae]|nr:Dothistromin biosynthesis regulatory protein aflJ [Metarhizium anisopliae]
MHINTLVKVDELMRNFIDATKAFSEQCQLGYSVSSSEVAPARQNLLTLLAELQVLLFQPTNFLRSLASQVQILACLQWLGDFQALACIPLNNSVQIQVISDITGVPEAQLSRILCMMTTAGFLYEPQPGYIAHTPLSASFVTQPSRLDAALFLAGTAAPAALNMTVATKSYGHSDSPSACAYSIAFNTAQSFQSSCGTCPKLKRQFAAYTRHMDPTDDGTATELLGRLDWPKLGNARVADVVAESISPVSALAKLYPSLNFIVQMDDTTSASSGYAMNNQLMDRISVQQRTSGQQQVVKGAAVYMVRLTSSVLVTPFSQLRKQILAELEAHVKVLSANPAATLILQVRVLPKTTSLEHYGPGTARVLDLSLLQVGSDRPMEITDIFALVEDVHHDGSGRLVIVKNMCVQNNDFVVLGVKYQAGSYIQ